MGEESDKAAADATTAGMEKLTVEASAEVEMAAKSKSAVQEREELLRSLYGVKDNDAEGTEKVHKFWSSQPVPQSAVQIDMQQEEVDNTKIGPLDAEKTVDDIRKEPYNLPAGFEWCWIDIEKEDELKEAYTLLTENYVEDDDGMFRFDYSPEFLRWALMPPGYFKEWIVGVRQTSNKRLLAMITGVPCTVHAFNNEEKIKMAEINFLCVHQKLRSKRLAPVLIKEITRRVNLENQWQAVYTAGVRIPTPIGVAQYFHRSLNPRKLIDVGFSRLARNMTMARTVRLYRVPEVPEIPNIRQMEPKDVKQVHALLNEHQKQFKVWIEFDEEEIAHWILPRDEVIYSYVVENAEGKITDFCSFYNLPSSILHHEKHKVLKAAYSFYNVATTVTLKELMSDALVFANKNNFDVFNALDIMDNKSFLKDLKFGEGDGRLHYYLYNYGIPEVPPSQVGIVLL